MRKSISVTFFSMVATLLVLGTAVLGCSEWLLFSRYFAQERYDTLDSVADVALYHQRQWPDGVYVGNNSFSGNLYGIDSHYLAAADYAVNYGRGFSASDFANCRKVALIDTKTAQSLFQGENPIGGTMEISGEPFTVVGVISPRVTSEPVINNLNDYYMYTGNTSGTVFIPDSCWPIVYRYDEPQSVAVRATSTNDMTTAGNNVAEYLNGHVISGDTFKYQSKDLLEQASQLQSLSESSNKQLIWIAAISLVVGGIGVMNIMLVSVTERTREIGVRKAMGAPNSAIRMQFIVESIIICLIGGAIGILLGIGLGNIAGAIVGTMAPPSLGSIVLAVGFSMGIGIFFGYYPANRAAKLDPIEALRYE